MGRRALSMAAAIFASMVLVISSLNTTSYATVSSSPNFQMIEPEFGAGSALETCSGSYCAKATIGNLSGEEAESQSYRVNFDPIEKDSEPSLEVIISPGQSNLGILSPESTATKTVTIQVRNHLSGGYFLQIYGDPPAFEEHSLKTTNTPTASAKGTEQFGINAVANTDPAVGTNPTYTSQESVITPAVLERYLTPNMFMYQSGDTVVHSTAKSSQISYTISMIINIAGTTPAGHYTADYSAVVTPAY